MLRVSRCLLQVGQLRLRGDVCVLRVCYKSVYSGYVVTCVCYVIATSRSTPATWWRVCVTCLLQVGLLRLRGDVCVLRVCYKSVNSSYVLTCVC